MALDVIGMYGGVSGGVEDALAQVDIPQDGVLIGIDWDFSMNLDADGELAQAELSFIATNQINTNDVRGRISSISVVTAVLTSVGSTTIGMQKWLGGFDLPMSGGERLYIHVTSSTGANGTIRCNLFYDSSGTMRRSARRGR